MYQFVDVTPLKTVVTLFSAVKLVPRLTEVKTNSLTSLVPVFFNNLQFLELANLVQVPVKLVTLSISIWLVTFWFYFNLVNTVFAVTVSWSHSRVVVEVRVVVAAGRL